jgi:hypothetical protein
MYHTPAIMGAFSPSWQTPLMFHKPRDLASPPFHKPRDLASPPFHTPRDLASPPFHKPSHRLMRSADGHDTLSARNPHPTLHFLPSFVATHLSDPLLFIAGFVHASQVRVMCGDRKRTLAPSGDFIGHFCGPPHRGGAGAPEHGAAGVSLWCPSGNSPEAM